ncbi:MAG: N-acetylmuramoyl-L-alanine amidase [Pseudomonadota bacterium]|nr:N-acetylmuramoyl-L-alanine amidase [Pseudomonadota bacterium]
MKIIDYPSPNFGDRARGSVIDKLIFHYTGMHNSEMSLSRLCDQASEVSAHYFIDESGEIYHLVSEEKRAWHAGTSYWAGETDINSQSIGIELQNPGHEWGYRNFPDPQISALIQLATKILSDYKIPEKNVLGHSDISPERKVDPGELFPWKRLALKNIGYWPKLENKNLDIKMSKQEANQNLSLIGYHPGSSFHAKLTAFQRHYRPLKLDGFVDKETAQLLSVSAKNT